MPINSAPQRGARDYQREVNLDGPLLWQDSPGSTAGVITSPTLNLTNWATLQLPINLLAGACVVTVVWYADTGLGSILGQRRWLMSSNINVQAVMSLINRGPFAQITFNPVGGNYTPIIYAYGSNRVTFTEHPTILDLLIDQQNTNLGAGLIATLYPASYYSGPVLFYGITTTASFTYEIQQLTSGNTWDLTGEFAMSALNPINVPQVVPLGAWRVQISNGGAGAGNYYVGVTATNTGST